MPPRRGRGAPPAGGTPTPAPDSRSRVQRTPGPTRFSSSYGSPAMLAGNRSPISSSAVGGLGNAIRTVQDSTSADRRTRAARRSAEASSQGAHPPPNQNAAAPSSQGPAAPVSQAPAAPPAAPPAQQPTAGSVNNNQRRFLKRVALRPQTLPSP